MLQFLKYVLATILGLVLFVMMGVFLVIGIAAASSGGDDTIEIKENSVLKLDLNKPIVDNLTADDGNPFAEYFGGNNVKSIGLVQIKAAIANAKIDPKIKGIYLDANFPVAGYATMDEIRESLLDFKKSGKPIYAYGEFYLEKGYYLSSVANKIYLNPSGGMDFNGLSSEQMFFKGALEKLEVKPVIFRVGEYKSFVEPFFLDKMSDANREQVTSYLGSIQQNVFAKIAQSRGFSVQHLNQVADSLSAFKPKGALKSQLITDLGYYDQFETDLKKAMKISDEKVKYLSVMKYLKSKSLPIKEQDSDNKIAVIVASGEINSGKSGKESIGSETIAEEIKKAREDNKVKAIVLRIDSPGGSSLASDVMWHEVNMTRGKKPIIASFGDVAASGGYYLGMACDSIVAQPTTITGSIGIFGMFYNVEGLLKNKLGITTDQVSTNAHSDFPSATHTLSPFEFNILQQSVNDGYETFTTKAAQGRRMSVAKLKTLASGRVWTGEQAKANGLVDKLGNLNDAIVMAAKKAKLKDYELKYVPYQKSFWQDFFDKGTEEAKASIMKAQYGELAPYMKQIQKLKAMEGVQARMMFDAEVK